MELSGVAVRAVSGRQAHQVLADRPTPGPAPAPDGGTIDLVTAEDTPAGIAAGPSPT